MNDRPREIGDNSLADLAARTETEHEAVSAALSESVRHAIAAGEPSAQRKQHQSRVLSHVQPEQTNDPGVGRSGPARSRGRVYAASQSRPKRLRLHIESTDMGGGPLPSLRKRPPRLQLGGGICAARGGPSQSDTVVVVSACARAGPRQIAPLMARAPIDTNAEA